MRDLDELKLAQYRARYAALQSRGRARAAAPKPMAEFADVPPADLIATDTLPPTACLKPAPPPRHPSAAR